MPRVAVGGFHHETNSFAPSRAGWAEFERADAWPGLVRGDALAPALAGQNIGASGFLAAAAAAGWEVAPLLWANAGPSGPVTEDAYERIAGELVERLVAAGAVDAVYLCLHGAMIADHLDDGEGELLDRLRGAVGPGVPIVASLDFHANVSRRMVAESDGLVAYRTYPHLDMAETGARTQAFLARLLETGRRPAKAFRKLPFLVPISAQCTLAPPASDLYGDLENREVPDICSLSLTMGFPPGDTPECGPAVLAYGDTEAAAEAAADGLQAAVLAAEVRFAAPLLSPAEAVAAALGRLPGAGGPVVLADTQDNPGAGGTADTTFLLRELVARGARGALLGVLHDPAAAAAAHRAGRDEEAAMALGGRSGIGGDRPFDARVRVEALSDGRFTGTGPFFGGSRFDLGPMALLRILDGASDGVRVVVSSVPQQAADRAMFAHLGADPLAARILAVKSSVHFRADFGPVAAEIIEVRAPGANLDDPAELPYRRLRPDVRRRPRREG
jgi:microcystin degradation protein MlrC